MKMQKLSLSDVTSLCSYRSRLGSVVWVFECPAGYFYALEGGFSCEFVLRLALCFRFCPTISHRFPDPAAHLELHVGEPVPDCFRARVASRLPLAEACMGEGRLKDASLPFRLDSYKHKK